MRQTELFPIIIDQEYIDDYVWFQSNLRYQKNIRMILILRINRYKRMYQKCEGYEGTNVSEIELMGTKKGILNAMESDKKLLIKTEDCIENAQNIINDCCNSVLLSSNY